jgi:hypothetical protein
MKKDMTSELTKKDYALNAAQALLKGIPYVGGSLEQFVFGPLQERRWRRVERTLAEVALALGPEGAVGMVQEQFANLLEALSPSLGRVTDENKRKRFRDLLTNAAKLSADDAKWEEASLAAELLESLEAPALAILAAISRCSDARSNKLVLTSRPVSQVFEGEFDYDSPGTPQHVLPYEWVVVEYWARMLRDKRLIWYGSHDARGGFGGVGLAPLGDFLTQWVVSE